jgi:class 3 adenylate cyclase/tetratricopeptide (TPR) repeat protein
MSEQEKLQQSIAALETQRTVLGDAVVDSAINALKQQMAALGAQPPNHQQQRKYITVLFADVSGFTAMSETLDAEEVAEIMNALWQQLDAAITENGGYIDKHIGDAVMALWGSKTAREDDPSQAIKAALAMQTVIRGFTFQRLESALQMRIGLNTGSALLGAVGSEQEFTAMGDTVNLASRLEHAAPVGGIMISHNTYTHVRGIFQVVPQKLIIIKGKKEPVQTYVVKSKKPRAFRLRTRGVEGVETHMIGRDAELRHLQDAFYTVFEDREMQMVTICGEAGIGKSRLLFEFENWSELQTEDYFNFKGRCREQAFNLPFFLIRDLISFRFQILESDSSEVIHEKLEQGIIEFMGAGHEEQAHFIGHLIGYHFVESPYLKGIMEDSKQVRDIAFLYLTQFFTTVTENKPAVILLEDLHWADDGSLELIQHLVQECRNLPILVICCTRPTFFERRPLWGEGQKMHLRLDLHHLSKRDSRRLINEILQKVSNIPTELRDLIVNGAEGNPFYLEELIKMLFEEGVVIKEEEQWQVETKLLAEFKVPQTLTGVLQARLDSLPVTERDILKCASVIGRVFWDKAVEGLRSLESLLSSEIHQKLQTLRSRELIFGRETSAFEETNEYLFKHALLRDVTYESVLLSQRRELHVQAAVWLIEKSGELVEQYAGLIGEHYEKSQQLAKAVEWYERAGKHAQDVYVPKTAIDFYQKALALLEDQSPENSKTSEMNQKRIKIYEGLGKVLFTSARLTEAVDTYTTLLTIATENQDVYAEVRSLTGLSKSQHEMSNFSASLDTIEKAETIARALGKAAQKELVKALLQKSVILAIALSDAESTLITAEEAFKLSFELDAKTEMAESLHWLGIGNRNLGRFEQAKSYEEQAHAIAKELGNPDRMWQTLGGLAEIDRQLGDYQSAMCVFQEGLNLVKKTGLRYAEPLLLIRIGAIKVELGEYGAAEELIRQLLSEWDCFGNNFEEYDLLARACLGQDKIEKALAAAQKSMTLALKLNNQWCIGMAWHVIGMVATRCSSVRINDSDYTATRCFAESLKLLENTNWKVDQAHALKDWAEYELKQGDSVKGEAKWQEARKLFKKLKMPLIVERMDEERQNYKKGKLQ